MTRQGDVHQEMSAVGDIDQEFALRQDRQRIDSHLAQEENEEGYESEEHHEGRDSDDYDINFEPCLISGISACEDYFTGIVKWPSLGGTYDDFVQAVESLQGDSDGRTDDRLFTIGLRADFDENSTSCCLKEGEITGLLHMTVNPGPSPRAARHIWDKIVHIDAAGRKQGFYALTVHCNWLNIL